MYLLIPLIEVVFCLGLLVVLMINGKRHIARKPFAIFLIFMAAWGFFIFMMRASTDLSAALVWEKFVFGSILSASLFFYRFAIALTGIRPNKYLMYSMYIAYFVVLGLIPTGLIVNGMQMMWYGKAPVIGPLFLLYVLCAYAPIVRSAMLLIKQYRRTRVIDDRVRFQYIMVGIAVMFIAASTDFFPALGINVYPMGIIGDILFCVAATMAMLKHNFLEMRVVLRKGTTYSLASIVIFCIFGSVVYFLSFFFRDFFSPVSLTVTIATVFIAAVVFQPTLSSFQQTVDRWFFRDRYKHIQVLKHIYEETKGYLDMEKLASLLLTSVENSMQTQGVYLLLPSPETGNYTIFKYSGKKVREQMNFSSGCPLIVAVKQQSNVIDSSDMEIIPSFSSLSFDDRQPLEVNGIDLIVPLKNNERLAGMLLLSQKNTHEPYSNEERRLLLNVSCDVAGSIDNANRYENIKQKHSELQKAIDGIIYAMSLVVESRDPYTAGHQRRVAGLARAIALEMGLSEWQVLGVEIAGLLHDVGKVAVPTEILSKPGKITQNEFSIIKTHCQMGYDILKKIEFPWPVTNAILQHHERLDGSGYPSALAAEEIIIEARILGVADVVEAMSSHRPYRPALGLESALAEISKGIGSLYDPDVVVACLNLLNNNQPEFERIMTIAEASTDSYGLELVTQ
jgi:putative nucleotidyltransferase with HDIG domain